MEKIQELTDKIYREGVEKGQAEAERIIAEAQKQAQQIVEEAQAQAQALEQEAQKKCEELDKNTKSELKLYAGQALNALKSEIATLLTHEVVQKEVAGLKDNSDFLNQFMLQIAQQWAAQEPVVVSAQNAEELKKYFAAHAKKLLDSGVTIRQVNGKEVLFTIAPADGSYVVKFGEEEFQNYFKEFLRPQLIKMLF